jgi:hypothetical protein
MNGQYEGDQLLMILYRVKMTELYDVNAIIVSDLGRKNAALYCNTGVPHTVIQV